MSNFTPAPWHFDGDSFVNDEHNRPVARIWNKPDATFQANARLLANAPDMYDALIWLNGFQHDPDVAALLNTP